MEGNFSNYTRENYYGNPTTLQTFVMFLISITAFLFNWTVFYVVPRLRGKIKSSTRYAMLNLAITDCLLGFCCSITRAIYLIDKPFFGKYICTMEGVVIAFLASMTILGLTFMNVDKFLTLLLPLHYKIWMTGRKAIFILSTFWLTYLALFIFALSPPAKVHIGILEGSFTCIGAYDEDLVYSLTSVIFLLIVPSVFCSVALVGMYCIIRQHKVVCML